MRVHYLQHVPFEGLGCIRSWLDVRSASLASTELFRSGTLPEVSDFDWLIVMGGPMSANDEASYPWLVEEKQLIQASVQDSKVVLGICLGAQLIAASQGSAVYPNGEKEIGWFRVEPVVEAEGSAFSAIFREPFEAFHWHGETFDLPPGAVRLAQSRVCRNQAFAIGERVLGLQFHPEMTPPGASMLVENCRNELAPGRWIQSAETILEPGGDFRQGNVLMTEILEFWGKQFA